MLMPPSSFASSHLVLLCFWIAFGNILKPSVGFLVKPCQYVIEKATRLQPLYSSRPRIVVIGAGVGGIATAARIKSAFPSCDVTVLEKNEKLGGRSGSFVRTIPGVGAFRHEQGPSLLLLPHLYRELFEDCSKDPKDFGLKMRQCIPAYQVVFDDGDRLNVGFPATTTNNNVEVKKLQLESRQKMNQLEPNGAAKWDEYMKAMSAFLDCGLPNFIEERFDLGSFPAFLREALRDFGRAWPLKPHSDVLVSFFESQKMRAMASFQDLYVGLEPYRNDKQLFGGVIQTTAPAVFGLLAAIELHPENSKAGGECAESFGYT